MADTTEAVQPTEDPGATEHTGRRPGRLNQALAWVGIAAGGLFIVAAVFFSGFFLSWSEHAGMGHTGMSHMDMGHMGMDHGSMDCCDLMKPGEPMMKPGAGH